MNFFRSLGFRGQTPGGTGCCCCPIPRSQNLCAAFAYGSAGGQAEKLPKFIELICPRRVSKLEKVPFLGASFDAVAVFAGDCSVFMGAR